MIIIDLELNNNPVNPFRDDDYYKNILILLLSSPFRGDDYYSSELNNNPVNPFRDDDYYRNILIYYDQQPFGAVIILDLNK